MPFSAPTISFRELKEAFSTKARCGWSKETCASFGSGASVELTGPAEFGIDSAMRSISIMGTSGHAPESARNFVVATESMEVVDLGTRFELAVNEETRESDVTVSEGLVDLHLGSPGAARRIQPLEAGFTAKLNEAGDILAMRQLQVESKTAPRLVAHWKLDEVPSGDLVSISGVAGRAVELGRNGFVDVSDWAEELGQTEAFTISALGSQSFARSRHSLFPVGRHRNGSGPASSEPRPPRVRLANRPAL